MRFPRWILGLALLFALVPPAPGQMVLVQKIPLDSEPTGIAASDNATLLAVPTADGILLIDSGHPSGKRPVPGVASAAMAIDQSRVVAGTRGGEVVAFDDLGVRLWSYPAGAPVTSVSLTWENRVFFTAGDTVGILDPTGREVQKRTLPDARSGSMSLGGTMFLVAQVGRVLALDSPLSTRWQVDLPGFLDAAPHRRLG